jgi:hypothetical protein
VYGPVVPRVAVLASAPRRFGGRCLYSRGVNAEFNWWLIIVGLVIGAGLVWLILEDSRRREVDVDAKERAGEARWIAAGLRRDGRTLDDDDVLAVLDEHASYLAAPPPDDSLDDEPPRPGRARGGVGRAPMARPRDDVGDAHRDTGDAHRDSA